MTRDDLERIVRDVRADRAVEGSVLKRSPVRVVLRVGDLFLKVFRRPARRARREARALERARSRGLPVPDLLGAGPDWVATRWAQGRPATRADLPRLLQAIERMHDVGMLHGDLHLGNLIVCDSGVVITDLHRSRFLPWIPGPLRRRELGWLAYSLGEPLPEALASVRFWRDLRARRHLRSRTRRCVVESGGFTPFAAGRSRGFRRRDADAAELERAIASPEAHECLKARGEPSLFRAGAWILKRHGSSRAARRAWINGRGLEVRGIPAARALAWAGPWLVMEDAGPTVTDWVDKELARAADSERTELADALADLLAELHRRGVYHADLKANNFAWAPGTPPRLLDYGRVRFGRGVSTRRRLKNLAQLNAALPDSVPPALRERAFRRYVERSALRSDPARLRRRVIALSLRRAHRWHGC
jgi:tRNA A-37 threonylcarbamoyl transferase component Bud32